MTDRRPANDEMMQGYMDGYDLDAPEPSENRSESYRHSFYVGRAEKLGLPMASAAEIEAHAELAMDLDQERSR